jgi:potassium-transporting ATPase KdpC subunit
MKSMVRTSIILLFAFAFVTGFLYPMLITGISQVLLPWQANGSRLLDKNGETIGSQNIGQSFKSDGYFWSRPSATVEYPYNATASGGSNLSVLNQDLSKQVVERINTIRQNDIGNDRQIPIDLVTSSASGLDPHISPEAALFQVQRIARVRGLSENQVRELVLSHTERPFLGIFGEPRVNVLLLNISLDSVQ